MRLHTPRFPCPVKIGRFTIDESGLTHEVLTGRYIAPADLAGGDVCNFFRSHRQIPPSEYPTIIQAVRMAVHLHGIVVERNEQVRFPDVEVFERFKLGGVA